MGIIPFHPEGIVGSNNKLFKKNTNTKVVYRVYRAAPGGPWTPASGEVSLAEARNLAALAAREGYAAKIIAIRYTREGRGWRRRVEGVVSRVEPRPAPGPRPMGAWR